MARRYLIIGAVAMRIGSSLAAGLFALLLAGLLPAAARGGDRAGPVDIGGDRQMFLQCSGAGSPTVVLISGKGNGAEDWSEILDPADAAHAVDYDAVAWGEGDLRPSDAAVYPSVARFTRVCAYDRPDVRLAGPDRSTPVAQPHPADQAADDLHRLLAAACEPGPYVLVPHSYGGVVATLFARTWPDEVEGMVMVDAATPLIRQVASPEAVATWDALNQRSVPEAPEAVLLLDAFRKIDAAAPQRPSAGGGAALRQTLAAALDPEGAARGGRGHLRRVAGLGGAARREPRRHTHHRDAQRSQHLCLLARRSSSTPFTRSSTRCGTARLAWS